MEIKLLEPKKVPYYNQFLISNSNSLIYSEKGFIELLSDHLNASSACFCAFNNDKLVGILPFIYKNGPLGKVFNSLPFYGSNGGVVQHEENKEIKKFLIRNFYEYAYVNKGLSATLISNPLEKDSIFYHKNTNFTHLDERISLITHLPISEKSDTLISMFENPRPRNIRKAIKSKVIVKKENELALEFLYKTHKINMEAIGGIPKKESFFQSIDKYIDKNNWSIFVSMIDQKPIAAVLLFYFNNTVEYFTPVILEEYRKTQALSLAIYEGMLDAITMGYKNWNWGGTWLTQGGVYDFKKKWGTSEYRYYYYTKLFNEEIYNYDKNFLLSNYQYFYTIPFDKIN